MGELELVIDRKATLGEGPCWDARRELLYWVDILECQVHIYDPKQNINRTINVGQYVGAVVPRESGGLILAMQHGFYALNPDTEELTPLVDPESNLPDNRFNDGKCDARGRFWAGTMNMDGTDEAGTLYCLETDLRVRAIRGNINCSNGIAWSPDNRVMYYIDSPSRQVAAFDYNPDSGVIDSQRTVVTIKEGEGIPDGMTMDVEGMIWVAQWDGWRVSRWNPNTGDLLETVQVPAARVTSCTFGGKDLNELYITTARMGLDERALSHQPYAGGVFRIGMKVGGIPTHSYFG